MKKCVRCGRRVERPNVEHCEECCYDLLGEEVEARPLGGHLATTKPVEPKSR